MLRQIFEESADLRREFGHLLDNRSELRKIYQGLREIIHNGAAIRAFHTDLWWERYAKVMEAYSWVRKIYARTERYAKVKKHERKRTRKDPWGHGYEVSFKVKKHDNIYKYNTGVTPDMVPAASRIPERPNGVFYPEHGVVVGYAHPPDAVGAPLLHIGGSCSARGEIGTCQSVATCGGVSIPGACPGSAAIQCCIE